MCANRGDTIVIGPRSLFAIATIAASLATTNLSYAQISFFHLIEAGPDPNPSIQLEIPFLPTIPPNPGGLKRLTSPSGEEFTASTTKSFASLDAALDFLSGNWHGVYLPYTPPGGAEVSFEFDVALVSPDALYRGLPLNVSLSDGERIVNGRTFLMSWDYESEEPIHQTLLDFDVQVNSFDFSSESLLSTPQPGFTVRSERRSGPTQSGSEWAEFARLHESEPGTSENRFLTTLTADGSGRPLPVDIAMTIGAATNLNSAITNYPDGDGNGLNDPPTYGLRYFRNADPIHLQLVPIPEPASLALAAFAIGAAGTLRRRSVPRQLA